MELLGNDWQTYFLPIYIPHNNTINNRRLSCFSMRIFRTHCVDLCLPGSWSVENHEKAKIDAECCPDKNISWWKVMHHVYTITDGPAQKFRTLTWKPSTLRTLDTNNSPIIFPERLSGPTDGNENELVNN